MYIKIGVINSVNKISRDHFNCKSINETIKSIKSQLAIKYEIDITKSNIRLFYDGKELRDEYTIFDYGVKVNNVIQLLINEKYSDKQLNINENICLNDQSVSIVNCNNKQFNNDNNNDDNIDVERINDDLLNIEQIDKQIITDKVNTRLFSDNSDENENEEIIEVEHCEYYHCGNYVDCLHNDYGAYFEGKIEKIYYNKQYENYNYLIKFFRQSLITKIIKVNIEHIRPPAYRKLNYNQINVGDLILVNYNLFNQNELGYWYCCLINKKCKQIRKLFGTIFIGDNTVLESKEIIYINELYRLEDNVQLSKQTNKLKFILDNGSKKREAIYECTNCKDNATVKCYECSCKLCGDKCSPDKQLICDECDHVYHIWCLPIPLNNLPPDNEDWYCHNCKQIEHQIIEEIDKKYLNERKLRTLMKRSKRNKSLVNIDENNNDNNNNNEQTDNDYKCKINVKKSSTINHNNKRWGSGLSCVGRTKINDTLNKDHFGPIPGINVGTIWRFRFQVSEVGLHKPLVAGIHGKELLGAYSIVFSCSYEDDCDLGNEIYYTGSGGKESDESKCRVGGPQVKDQQLRRCNKALAMNCAAKFNDIIGANAGNKWKDGKPVRVLRSGNARGAQKKSIYLPKVGIRYDGIYKVVKYWPEKNKNGFIIWKFYLRRDDQYPAPWTKEGKRKIRQLGLKIINPDGWIENECNKTFNKRKANIDNDYSVIKVKRKRKYTTYNFININILNLVKSDLLNENIWSNIFNQTITGIQEFKSIVEDAFKCVYCLERVKQPITTFCNHNICKECFEKSLQQMVDCCPICRQKFIKKSLKPQLNLILANILDQLYL